MSFGTFDPDALPAIRARAIRPRERQNERSLVLQAMMARDPEGQTAWTERYAEMFGRLFDTDDHFCELVRKAHLEQDHETLAEIQSYLDHVTETR